MGTEGPRAQHHDSELSYQERESHQAQHMQPLVHTHVVPFKPESSLAGPISPRESNPNHVEPHHAIWSQCCAIVQPSSADQVSSCCRHKYPGPRHPFLVTMPQSLSRCDSVAARQPGTSKGTQVSRHSSCLMCMLGRSCMQMGLMRVLLRTWSGVVQQKHGCAGGPGGECGAAAAL